MLTAGSETRAELVVVAVGLERRPAVTRTAATLFLAAQD